MSEDSITVGNSVLIKVSGAEDEVDKEVIVSWWFEVSAHARVLEFRTRTRSV